MMAAAQMHREGRLVQSEYGEPYSTGGKEPAPPSAPPQEPEKYFPSDGNRKGGPAMMTQKAKGTQVAENDGIEEHVYKQIEDALYGHATGNLSPAEVHKLMPEGYKVDLRRGGQGPYEVIGPSSIFYVTP